MLRALGFESRKRCEATKLALRASESDIGACEGVGMHPKIAEKDGADDLPTGHEGEIVATGGVDG